MTVPAYFFASSGAVAGGVPGALLTLHNPVGSLKVLKLLSFHLVGVATAGVGPALYQAGRSLDRPTVGSVVRACRGVSSVDPVAEVLLQPTVTLGDVLWSGSPGAVTAVAVLGTVPFPVALPAVDTRELLELAEGETLVVGVTKDSAGWTHHGNLLWVEE